jgi:hypothetical protein
MSKFFNCLIIYVVILGLIDLCILFYNEQLAWGIFVGQASILFGAIMIKELFGDKK